jgi:hypothetical protein
MKNPPVRRITVGLALLAGLSLSFGHVVASSEQVSGKSLSPYVINRSNLEGITQCFSENVSLEVVCKCQGGAAAGNFSSTSHRLTSGCVRNRLRISTMGGGMGLAPPALVPYELLCKF